MATPSILYPKKVDLTNCDKEPIHLLGNIQSHGMLLVLRKKDASFSRVSSNIFDFFSRKREELKEFSLVALFGNTEGSRIQEHIDAQKKTSIDVTIKDGTYVVIPHYTQDLIYIELEQLTKVSDTMMLQQQLSEIITELSEASSVSEMCDKTTALIKDFLGYDRVMVYQFDEHWNGEVIAETREKSLESWLGMHYPASDIPQQARALFLKQGVRIISDVTADAVSVYPELDENNLPLDLSRCETRAVSPIHIEYLKNMKVGATATAAIISDGKLWGLIACHNYSPKFITYYQRLSIKFLTQVFSTQLTLRSSNEVLTIINNTTSSRATLVDQMSDGWNVHRGLTELDTTMLSITDATGAAVWLDGQLSLVGEVPQEKEILEIIHLINDSEREGIYSTQRFAKDFESGSAFAKIASGILYVPITQDKPDCLVWFKPELKQTITWAGNPDKAVEKYGERISPRESFEKWNEEQTQTSLDWKDYEISSAKALRDSITGIIISKYDEVKQLNEQLQIAYKDLESFSYSVSHDLRAPLRGIDGFAQIIKEDYFESLDEYGKSAIQMIIDSSDRMNDLIDDILSFSSLGYEGTSKEKLATEGIVKEVIHFLNVQALYQDTTITIENDLPEVYGDKGMIFQLYSNLIGNALKYSKKVTSPEIVIGSTIQEGQVTYFVKDNGIGFNDTYAEKIFGIFKRLVDKEYEGSGIGLAIVQRVIDKHNGKIWAESKEAQGTTFYFQVASSAL